MKPAPRHLLAGFLALVLAGCASRGPPPPPMTIRSLALLSVDAPDKLRYAPTTVAGSAAEVPFVPRPVIPVVIHVPRPPRIAPHFNRGHTGHGGRGNSSGSVGASIGAGIAFGLIMHAIDMQRALTAQNIANVLERAAFDPADALTDKLGVKLGQLSVPLLPVTDSALAQKARSDYDYALLKTSADAVLDIKINEYGFSKSMSDVFTPYLGITMSLINPKDSSTIDSWNYWSDQRVRAEDRRWFTAPPSLVFDGSPAFTTGTETMKVEFNTIIGKMAERMLEDLDRRIRGLPAL